MIVYMFVIFIIFLVLITLGTKWEINRKAVVAWSFIMAFLACLSLYSLDKYFVDLPVLTKGLLVLSETGIATLIVISIFFFIDLERTPLGGN